MKYNQKQLVKVFCLCQLILETLDSFKETNEYKQEIKRHTNQYLRFLERNVLKHIDEIFEYGDAETEKEFTDIMRNSELFVDTALEDFVDNVTFAKSKPHEVQEG